MPDLELFKTYDCRGKYGEAATAGNFFFLGKAARSLGNECVAGMDYREHNDELVDAFVHGFGDGVSFIGNCPTPVVSFHSKRKLGVSFTASHNPPEYNGAKFRVRQRCLFEEEMQELKEKYLAAGTDGYKPAQKKPEEKREYLKATTAHGPAQIKLEEKRELLDEYADALPSFEGGIYDLCGGAACALKDVFPEAIFTDPDPKYERHSAEPKDDTLAALKQETLAEKKVGFAFDGDGDRLVVVDEGKTIDGSITAAFFAVGFLPKKSKVVLTLDNSDEVFTFLRDRGFQCSYCQVGDVYLVKQMLASNAAFGAERSGHFYHAKHLPDSDGLYFAAMLSSLRKGELLNFAGQFKNETIIEQMLVSVDFGKLAALIAEKEPGQLETVDGVKARFDDYCLLIRASKTEPKIRVNVEAKTKEKAAEGMRLAKQFVGESKT